MQLQGVKAQLELLCSGLDVNLGIRNRALVTTLRNKASSTAIHTTHDSLVLVLLP